MGFEQTVLRHLLSTDGVGLDFSVKTERGLGKLLGGNWGCQVNLLTLDKTVSRQTSDWGIIDKNSNERLGVFSDNPWTCPGFISLRLARLPSCLIGSSACISSIAINRLFTVCRQRDISVDLTPVIQATELAGAYVTSQIGF